YDNVEYGLGVQSTGSALVVERALVRRPRPRADGRGGQGLVVVAGARAQALYLGHVGLGVPLVHAAGALGRDRASARRACARIETLRDAPGVDHAFACLEGALRALRERLHDIAGEARP
ncbi:MAG: hypothetical protein ACO27F_14240, partial [Beijerinckiaceae bacterium]